MKSLGFLMVVGGIWLVYQAWKQFSPDTAQAASSPQGPRGTLPAGGAQPGSAGQAQGPAQAGGSNPQGAATSAPSGRLSAADMAAGLLNVGYTADQAATQVAILLQENGGKVSGCSSAGACGFAQIIPTTGAGAGLSEAQRLGSSPQDVAAQFQAVRNILSQQGFGAWDPYSYAVNSAGQEYHVLPGSSRNAGGGNYLARLGEAQAGVAQALQGYCSPWGAFASWNCSSGAA